MLSLSLSSQIASLVCTVVENPHKCLTQTLNWLDGVYEPLTCPPEALQEGAEGDYLLTIINIYIE